MAERAPTDRQARILEVIQSFTEERGYPPSVREIGELRRALVALHRAGPSQDPRAPRPDLPRPDEAARARLDESPGGACRSARRARIRRPADRRESRRRRPDHGGRKPRRRVHPAGVVRAKARHVHPARQGRFDDRSCHPRRRPDRRHAAAERGERRDRRRARRRRSDGEALLSASRGASGFNPRTARWIRSM